ncbi:MAG: 4-alpha-glucanotransferase [Burkholderiales bacterium]
MSAERLARYGIAAAYTDIEGRSREASPEALAALVREFDDAPPPIAASAPAPGRCHPLPPARVWGPSVQLYALRSARNWGMGDFGDLAALIDWAAARGAALVGLNPLHALFADEPAHCSPYSPSTRLAWNTLYLDVEAIPEYAECADARTLVGSSAFRARLARLREAPRVDYPGVAAAKQEVLRLLYSRFGGSPRVAEFERFRSDDVRRHAAWEAQRAGGADPRYYEYLQWQADAQLAVCAESARARGMAVGLYLDIAVSTDRAGSEVEAHPELFARHASIGAPPDAFNPRGQDWGQPPPRPDRMRATGYALFRRVLATSMRHAGAVRIDHVMQLARLYWVPAGFAATDGAYVRYPLEALLAVLAEESRRHRCLVVGEDLGTVPPEVREGMARAGIAGIRLLRFERDARGEFIPPAAYPAEALCAVGTHDMPTLAGWLGDAAFAADRDALGTALGALPDPVRVHACLAASPCRLMLLQPEDALGVTEPWNVPGTTTEHPNWQRKLPLSIEDFGRSAPLERVVAAIRGQR